MSRYKYRFTLHQIYNYYGIHGDLRWRSVADAGGISLRTLGKYFECSSHLESLLADYHLSYLAKMYTRNTITARNYPSMENRFKVFRIILSRFQVCYRFSAMAATKNLDGRGAELKQQHLEYIKNAMRQGGVDESKILPEIAFQMAMLPLPDNEVGDDFFYQMMIWFVRPRQVSAFDPFVREEALLT